MKFTRTIWLIILLVVLAIACASMYVVNSGKASQGEELQNKLDRAAADYSQLVAQRVALDSQLAQGQIDLAAAKAELDVAEAQFPPSIEQTINYDEILFWMADYCQLEIMSLTASAPGEIKAGGVTYSLITFNVVVRPKPADPLPATAAEFETYIDESVADILHFVDTIATGEGFVNATTFVNGTTIESVVMSNLEPPTTDEEVPGAAKPEASITMVIYSYPGA